MRLLLSRLGAKKLLQDQMSGSRLEQIFPARDIRNCIQFRILAQQGAASSWHMDNAGVLDVPAYAGREQGRGEVGQEEDEDVENIGLYSLRIS